MEQGIKRYWIWLALAIVLLFAAGVRLRLLHFPIERDEGEYAYMGQLMLQGVPPYQTAWNMKFPGTYAAYAAIMAVFGQSVAGIRLGFLLVNAGCILLVFAIAWKMWGRFAALAAAAAYALCTLGNPTLMAGHATHLVVLFMLAGLLLVLQGIQNHKLWIHFVAGMMLGLSVLMKQHAIFIVPLAMLLPLADELAPPRAALRFVLVRISFLLLGVALPLFATGLILWQEGVFPKFWFWTVNYAVAYASQIPLSRAPWVLIAGLQGTIRTTYPLWVLGGIGFLLVCIGSQDRQSFWFAIGLGFFSSLAVVPGFIFRPHYFIVVMPFVAMMLGAGLSFIDARVTRRWLAPLLLLAACWSVLVLNQSFLFTASPDALTHRRLAYQGFGESEEVATWIRERTSPSDTIAVLGSEPQLYFLSHRRSSTGYIYTYPLMEGHAYAKQMQKEMAGEIEAAAPRYLAYFNGNGSWGRQPASDTWIFDWYNQYRTQYEVVGVVEFLADRGVFRWDNDAKDFEPTAKDYILIYRRK
jgi:hypothetical protein